MEKKIVTGKNKTGLYFQFPGVTPIIRAIPPDDRREDEVHCVQGRQSPVENRVTGPDSNLDDLESDGSMESDGDDTSNISPVMKQEIQQVGWFFFFLKVNCFLKKLSVL